MGCTLELDLDAPSFRAGEQVTGAVVVEVHELAGPAQARVWVDLGWHTESEGTPDRGPVTTTAIERAQPWRAGERLRLPFAVQAPAFPVTIEGESVRVVWTVVARTDLPSRFDPSTERAVVILPGEPDDTHLPDIERATCGEARSRRTTRSLALLVPLLAGPPILWALGTEYPSASLLVLALMVAEGVRAAWSFRKTAAERKLGPVDVSFSDEVAAGGEVAVELAFRPPRPLELTGIGASLSCTETVRGREVEDDDDGARISDGVLTLLQRLRQQRRGRTSRTQSWQVHATLHPGGSLRGQHTVQLQARLPVRPDALPSFQAPNHSIVWTLCVQVGIAGWPDWQLDVPVAVLPARAP